MKKISCNVYQDILPLYADEVVSPDTREFVKEHLQSCSACRGELEKMQRPIELPSESAKPLESIKKQWKQKNSLIWVLSLALVASFLLMALPFFDTAMQYHIQELVGNLEDYWYLLLPLTVIGFGLEWWFIHLKKIRWLKYVLLALPAALLVLAEATWAAGGWDRIGSSILWWIGFPLLLGAGLAALLRAALDQNRQGRTIIAIVVACSIALAAFFWPKGMYDTIQVDPDLTMLAVYPDGEQNWMEISRGEVDRLLQWAKISPCATAPDWNEERCILLRLNESYVLLAPYADTPYVYEYSGPLEEFDGQDVCYSVYHFSALYIELKTSSSLIAE